MDMFDIHYIGWHSQPNDISHAASMGITLHNCRFWDQNDQFGQLTFPGYVNALQPDIVLSLGDPWMIEHIAGDANRNNFTWISYVPIDRDVISKGWRQIMKKPDVLVLYSKFGEQVINDCIPFRNARTILHGIDRTLFKPFFPEGTDENTPHKEVMKARKKLTLGDKFEDKFIVGWVGRNQVRKNMPRTIRAFKAFNCKVWAGKLDVEVGSGDDKEIENYTAQEFCRNKQCFRCDVCPAFEQREETKHSIVYLHTTRGSSKDGQDRPGVGWLVDEIADRHDLRGRVGVTPGTTALKGLSREALSQMMNCFDVHCFLSHSEGFGLPIAETLGCGVPTLVTNYSSMPELVSEGGGFPIKVHDYTTYVTYENELANADIGEAADRIDEIFSDDVYAAELREAAKNNMYTPDWHQVAAEFRDLILEAMG